MSRESYNAKIAVACWAAMFIVVIAGGYAIRLEPVVLLDNRILAWFAASRTAALDQILSYLTRAGSIVFLVPLVYAIAVIIAMRGLFQEAMFLVCSFIGASVLTIVVKHFIARPRPNLFPAVIDIPAGFSFPSSHSVQISAFVLALLLALKSSTGARWQTLFSLLGGSLILVVCLSRLYLQAHFPTDVMAGFLTAFFCVAGLSTLMLPDRQVRATPLRNWWTRKGTQP